MRDLFFGSIFFVLLGTSWSYGDSLRLGKGASGDVFYTHFAPDPVNIRTGNFYLPSPDYVQTCFGFNLELQRSFNSFSGKVGPFGKGWTHSYEIQLTFDPKTGLSIVEADGFLHTYDTIESKEVSSSDIIDSLVNARLEEDRKEMGAAATKSVAAYKDYREKLSKNSSFFNSQRERYLGVQDRVSKSKRYYSSMRGYSEVLATQTGYERTFETGQKEIFDSKGKILRFEDRNNNQLSFRYDTKSRLSAIDDQCKQFLQFSYDTKGRVDTIVDHMQRKMVYAYDEKDHLKFATGLDAKTTEYVYDTKDQMVGIKFTPKTIVTMEYDPKSGRVLSQRGPGSKVTTYTYVLSGGTMTTTVKDNEGENSKYEFVDGENKTIFTDSSGKKTITEFLSCCGKTLSVKDDKGVGETFKYDTQARLIEVVNALKQTSIFKYDPRSEKDFTFRLPVEIKDFDKTTKTYKYDSKGNLTFGQSTSGEYAKVTYEEHGKIKSLINQDGISIHFLYDKGLPISIEKRKADSKTKSEETVGSMTIDYNTLGEVSAVNYKPRLEKTIDDMKATLISMYKILKPVGIDFNL